MEQRILARVAVKIKSGAARDFATKETRRPLARAGRRAKTEKGSLRYGKIAPNPDAVRAQRPSEPPGMGPREVTVRDEKVREPQLQRAYIVPSGLTAQPGEAEALNLLGSWAATLDQAASPTRAVAPEGRDLRRPAGELPLPWAARHLL